MIKEDLPLLAAEEQEPILWTAETMIISEALAIDKPDTREARELDEDIFLEDDIIMLVDNPPSLVPVFNRKATLKAKVRRALPSKLATIICLKLLVLLIVWTSFYVYFIVSE